MWRVICLAFFALRRRRRAGVLAAVVFSTAATAQSTANGLDLQRYRPGPGINDVLSASSARTGGHLRWQAGVSLDYAHRPLALYNLTTNQTVNAAVDSQTTLNLMGALGLTDVLELGLVLPVVFQPTSSQLTGVTPSATGLGDLRFTPRVRLWANERVAFGLAATLQLPTAGGTSFRGASGVGVLPRAGRGELRQVPSAGRPGGRLQAQPDAAQHQGGPRVHLLGGGRVRADAEVGAAGDGARRSGAATRGR